MLLEDLLKKFKETVEVQAQKQPKVAILKNELIIGSKNSANFVSFSPNISFKRLTSIKVTAKFSDNPRTNRSCLDLIANNAGNANVLWSYLVLSLVSKVTPTILFNLLGHFISSNVSVSNINTNVVKTKTSFLSKEGQTVKRSLSTVRNKLLTDSASEETQKLLLNWFSELQGLAPKFKNASALVEVLKAIKLEKAAESSKNSKDPKDPKV